MTVGARRPRPKSQGNNENVHLNSDRCPRRPHELGFRFIYIRSSLLRPRYPRYPGNPTRVYSAGTSSETTIHPNKRTNPVPNAKQCRRKSKKSPRAIDKSRRRIFVRQICNRETKIPNVSFVSESISRPVLPFSVLGTDRRYCLSTSSISLGEKMYRRKNLAASV